MSKICAYGCLARKTSSSYGQCFYIMSSSDIFSNNYVNDSSISNSENDYASSYYVLHIGNGRVLLTRENISKNECAMYPALYCFSSYNAAYTCYCSFVNNTADSYGCLYFDVPQEIHNCNILFNEQISTSYGTIYSRRNLYPPSYRTV